MEILKEFNKDSSVKFAFIPVKVDTKQQNNK
jgi:hypothetical protein